MGGMVFRSLINWFTVNLGDMNVRVFRHCEGKVSYWLQYVSQFQGTIVCNRYNFMNIQEKFTCLQNVQKLAATSLNSNLIREFEGHGFVSRRLLCATLVKTKSI